MKKLLILFSWVLFALNALGQSTTISSTIIDPLGNSWNYGTVTAVFKNAPNSSMPPVWSGGAFNPIPATVALSSSGAFTMSLPSTNAITPAGGMWIFSVCPNSSQQCAVLTTAVVGTTLDIVPLMNTAAVWPPNPVIPTPIAKVYNTNQTFAPPLNQGGMLYDTTTQAMLVYTSAGWQPFATVGSGVPVLTNPPGSQVITQPSGTSLTLASPVSTSGNNMNSPSYCIQGSYFNVTNQPDPWCFVDTVGTGTEPNSTISLTYTGSSTGTHTIAFGNPFTAPSVNGVLNATDYPGSDIGAQVNAAYAACPSNGCRIRVPASASLYSFTTPIVFGTAGKNATLEGDPGHATALYYTASTGTAITIATTNTGNVHFAVGSGIRDLYLLGTGQAGTVGIQLGSSTNAAEGFLGFGVHVDNFPIEVTWAAPSSNGGTFDNQFISSDFLNATSAAWLWPATGVNISGENMSCVQCVFGVTSGSTAGQIQILGPNSNWNFVDTSFDNAQIVIDNGSSMIHTTNAHHEHTYNDTNDFVLVESGLYSETNAQYQIDPTTGTAPSEFVYITGTSNTAFSDFGFSGFSGQTIAKAIHAASIAAPVTLLGLRQAIGITATVVLDGGYSGYALYQATNGTLNQSSSSIAPTITNSNGYGAQSYVYGAQNWLTGYWNGNTNYTVQNGTSSTTPFSISSSTGVVSTPYGLSIGANTVYRCTTAGTLPVGALTITSASCGASTATALQVN